MENKKCALHAKLAEADENKGNNSSSLIPRQEYERIVSHLNELKATATWKTKEDYLLLWKFDILEITFEGTTVQRLQTQLQVVCAEAIHRTTGHGG